MEWENMAWSRQGYWQEGGVSLTGHSEILPDDLQDLGVCEDLFPQQKTLKAMVDQFLSLDHQHFT